MDKEISLNRPEDFMKDDVSEEQQVIYNLIGKHERWIDDLIEISTANSCVNGESLEAAEEGSSAKLIIKQSFEPLIRDSVMPEYIQNINQLFTIVEIEKLRAARRNCEILKKRAEAWKSLEGSLRRKGKR